MNAVIGSVLPVALGIALSPLPIVAVILLLMSPKAKASGFGFLVGWVLGVVAAVLVFTAVSSLLPESGDGGPQPLIGVIKIVLGAALLVLAVKQWRSRPAPGEEPALPKWMSAIDDMGAGKALAIGVLLSGLNPKNLLLGASAGVLIGSASLDSGSLVLVVVIYTLLASVTIIVPVVGAALAPAASARMLQSLRVWLTAHNAAIMAVVFVLLGVSVIGKGIGSF